MKKTKLFLVVAILILNSTYLIFNCSASTSVPGGYISGHWTLAGSPYNIMGTVNIKTDSTLIIDPGVTVNFQTALHLKMLVNGRLLAVGTASQNIYFTATDHTNGFGGIRFNALAASNDTSKFIYCDIQYGMDGASPYNNGGALYFKNWNKAIISHCTIMNCKSSNGSGGAIYCSVSSPIITYNKISNNTVYTGFNVGGGAIYLENNTNAVISYNTISGNSATFGGGIYCSNVVNALISYNTISNNSSNNGYASSGGGGGIFCTGTTTISNNTISNNTADTYQGGGGGIFCAGTTTISNNTISNNSATTGNLVFSNGGGGIYINNSTFNSISHNIISGNSATVNGGGIYCDKYSILNSIDNSSITNNSANLTSGNGGGIYLDGKNGSNIPNITNVTIANNKAFSGGGMYGLNTCNPIFSNCILWGNTDNWSSQVFLFDEPSDPDFYYCDVQGGQAAIVPNGNFYSGNYTNNINTLPRFVTPSAGSGSVSYQGTYNWTLQVISPCRNTGDPGGTYPATDLAGNTRVYAGIIDMGAYEYQMSVSVSQTSVTCHGLSDGTATATVINGDPNYIYAWSANAGSQTTQTATGLAAGTYTVAVTDGLSATASGIVTILQPAVLFLSPFTTNAVCANADGTATITPSGGTKPYSYLWSTNATDSTITGLVGGQYSVWVYDYNSCFASSTVTVQIDNNIPPQTPSICMVTVDPLSTHNIIYWDKTNYMSIDSFKIYREVTTNTYAYIASVSKDSLSEYHDYGADPNVTSYKYKLTLKDSCGNESALSDYHNTIHLQNLGNGNLQWTLYGVENAINPVSYYRIYRDDTNTGNYLPINSIIPGGNSTFTDGNYNLFPNANYRVDVAWSISCTPTRATVNTTRSNIKHQSISIGIQTNEHLFSDVTIYPNPFTSQTTITFDKEQKNTTIKIMGVLGKEVKTVLLSGAKNLTIERGEMDSGIYFVQIIDTNKNVLNKKIVVQ